MAAIFGEACIADVGKEQKKFRNLKIFKPPALPSFNYASLTQYSNIIKFDDAK